MKTTATLSLTGLETVFLSDALRNADNISQDNDQFECLKPLVVNLASLYIELLSREGILPGPLDIEITEPQAWLLRQKVRTGDIAIDGKTNVGVSLLTKLYNILIMFSNQMQDIETSELDEPMLNEQNKYDLKEQVYARWRPDENTYPRRDPYGSP